MSRLVVVKAVFDPEAEVWFTESSDLPGLCIEGATVDELMAKLPDAVVDLLEDSGEAMEGDVAIELIAHASTRARLRAAAA
jgi:predicted RNase H-like HicB family nuclease